MPNPNAVVSFAFRLEPPLDRAPAELLRADRGIGVELEGGRRVRLNPADPRSAGLAAVLDGIQKQRLPVYLEVDPQTSTIERLLIPHVSHVREVRPAEDGLSVELERSHAVHHLRRASPDFAELEGRLREAKSARATVVVAENDAHEIIDVRGYAPPPGYEPPFHDPGVPPRPGPLRLIRELIESIWRWPWWPWWWFRCISAARAQQVFDAMNATSCAPLTVPVPCIPFFYPDDGCWGRAHEMCRLMIAMGLSPAKVWIQGRLHAATRNNPNCFVNWGWHVAPTLCVRGPGLFQHQTMVIDPSLFTTPVSEAGWKAVQGDPGATLTESAASIFYLWGSVTDPTYVQTNQVLATYRLQLQLRALNVGPPPYANCP